MLSCKIRVMPARLLLLTRFFLRLDDVVLRIRDTRVFVEFKTRQVIREYTAREEKYETLKQKLSSNKEDATSMMRDPNNLVGLMPVVERTLESLVLT
jgi:type 2A phosphatase activator TIP41